MEKKVKERKYHKENVVSYKGREVGSIGGGKHWSTAELQAKHKADELVSNNRTDLKAPDWLDRRGITTFNKLVKQYEHFDILDVIDSEILAVYCDIHCKYVKLKKDIDLDTFHGVELRQKITTLQTYSKILLQYASKLGLSPESRKKIAVNVAKEIIKKTNEESKFNV